jgi:predicted nucleotidyltransferase
MESLRRVATELEIPERTLRRAAAEGLVRGERVSPRRFQVTLREEAYLRTHWPLLSTLRAALRTEPNVRLAVLFGSTATGSDDERSDVNLFVVSGDGGAGRLAELASRLARRLDREVQIVKLSEAKDSPALLLEVVEEGRVLVDRDDLWRGLQKGKARLRRKASLAEKVSPVALGEPELGSDAA